jgi:hypothetical protein
MHVSSERRAFLAFRVTFGGCALAAWQTLFPADALANGRMPSAHQLVFSPGDPTFVVMETTFGLLISKDGGSTFDWVCEASIGYGTRAAIDPSVGLTPGHILAGLPQGLAESVDQGCSWSLALGDPVIDLVVRPDDPHTALALTSSLSTVGDAGENLYTTRVLATHDDGAHWTQQGASIDPRVQVETIEVARSDPNRIYIGGATSEPDPEGGVQRAAVVLASTDGGTSYTASTIALSGLFEASQGAAFVSGTDPTNADRVYVRIGDLVVDRLVVSDDGAATFRTTYQGNGPLLGFALASDGSKVFVGGPRDGVLVARAGGSDASVELQFVMQSRATVSCLAWSAGTLYACMGEPQNAFLQQLGESSDDGATFAPRFFFSCMSGPLSCPGGAVVSTCSGGLDLVRASIGVCPDAGSVADAGPDDAGGVGDATVLPDTGTDAAGISGDDAGAGSPQPRRPTASCGCNTGTAEGTAGVALLVLAAGAMARRGRA